ncbi:MAG: hypothetical protein ABT05_07715, partial [Lautropia sp. SCN 66-9]
MSFISKAGIVLGLLGAHLACAAADFPSQPVTIVVPYSAGQIDVFTRALAKGLTDEWKHPVIVDNRAGGNEAVGADVVARAAPTGYTILIGTEASYVLNPLLFKKLSYNPQTQLAPVSLLVRAPLVFLASPKSAANSMKEVVDMAKSRGRDPVRYGSSGVGGVTHLPYAGLARDHGLTLIHVLYKGGAAVMQDLLAGHIESALLGAGLVSESFKAGKLKALAVSAPKRISALPNVPTIEEQGIPDINAIYTLGLAVPVGTPQDVIDKIAATAR